MPTHKLTKVYLESIAPTDRDTEIRDTVVPGFLCKITPSGRRYPGSPYVCPWPGDEGKPLGTHPYFTGWKRILKRAGVPHVGSHGIRHRAATDIANSGVSVKVGMALTSHKTVTIFMRYVHAEDDPIRGAAALVSERRRS